MAFQTNVLRNGAWVTETVDIHAALRASSSSAEKPKEVILDHPPCGILSSTIVDSPVVHKILPVRLRSRSHNDIAMIGDHLVTIRELQDNGQTYEVLKYQNFGSRIRNAIVLGTCPDEGLNETSGLGNSERVDELYQASVGGFLGCPYLPLPPQILVLFLETGELVFLFIREVNNKLEFCVNKHSPGRNVPPYLGHHLAVDPSSRFMAAASFEEILVVYELEPRSTLNERYMATGSLGNPIRSTRFRALRGTVYDVQFLYPRPQDDYHIILMVIISSKSREPDQQASRKYIVWDWEVGEDLRTILGRSGHRQSLAKSGGVPMFSIPLKSQNSFFIVYPHHIALVKQALSFAEYDSNLVLEGPDPSDFHHGANAPLWTSWARPFRRKEYSEKTDIIYLAREDGFVFHIEIDSMTLVYSTMELGSVGTGIGTAFTTAYDRFSDLFVIGSEAAPGGVWKLAARSELERVSTFDNWSPVVDIAEASDYVDTDGVEPGRSGSVESPLQQRPGRLFFASGRGASGSLVELRIGLKARIGTELDVGQPAKQAWLFADQRVGDGSMYAMLAQPHCTSILCFAADFVDVREEASGTTPFDTTSRTLHAVQTASGTIVQVSERSVTLVTASQSSRHYIGDVIDVQDAVAEKAFCLDDMVVISVQGAHEAQLHVLRIEQMAVTLGTTWTIPGEISCLSQFHLCKKICVAVGSMVDGGPMLSIYSLNGDLVAGQRVGKLLRPRTHGKFLIKYDLENSANGAAKLEALTSICIVRETDDVVDIVAGTRCGHLLTIKVSHNSPNPVTLTAEKLGATSVDVFPSSDLLDDDTSAFATCDNSLIRLSALSAKKSMYGRKDMVWPTDVSDPSLPAPPIHSVFTIRPTINGVGGKHLLLLLSGTRLYVADVESHVDPVPRTIALGFTPTRILFSKIWKCLVVAVQKDKGVDLVFIDPDTGMSISKPLDGDKTEGYLTSFQRRGDKILGLNEWNYVKDGRTFPFMVVTMQSGKLVIVSVSRMECPDARGRTLHHWTRYRRKGFGSSVSAVVTDSEGVIYCAGATLYREVLDLTDKKLKPAKVHELETPATSLEIVDGKLVVLTTAHSIEILDYTSSPGDQHMILLHSDRVSRVTMHMARVEHTMNNRRWLMSIVSDITGGIAGVWVPEGQGNKDLVTIFEASLNRSVRRFVRTQCRPVWLGQENLRPRFNLMPKVTDGAELLGVSVDGTLRHFKLLGMELWLYLRFIQELAQRSCATDSVGIQDLGDNEERLEPEIEPRNMHIDGDVLGYCLEQRLLESMVEEGGCLELFCRYLDGLEGGILTRHFGESDATSEELMLRYFELGYGVLEDILGPVL